MKSLVGVYTCHNYDYGQINDWVKHPVVDRIPAIRDTWLKDLTVDYKLFYGKPKDGKQPQSDEVFLNVPDGYTSSSYKTKALAQWALDNNYDRMMKVDDDIFVHWDRMQNSEGFSCGDYVGGGWSRNDPYVFGGCYWLSARAMEVIVKSPINPTKWAEDAWVGFCLDRANIFPSFDTQYFYQRPPEATRLQYVDRSVLFSNHNYTILHALDPDTMREYYKTLER